MRPLVFTCSWPMAGMPGDGPEAMDVALICPAIWPMLVVARLGAIETLLRLMPLLLYMLPPLCWLNCGDACCCGNMLRENETTVRGDASRQQMTLVAHRCPRCYLLPAMPPWVQPFISGEPWKAAPPWPCCIMGDWAWAMRGDSRGLWGVPGPPKLPSAGWFIPEWTDKGSAEAKCCRGGIIIKIIIIINWTERLECEHFKEQSHAANKG